MDGQGKFYIGHGYGNSKPMGNQILIGLIAWMQPNIRGPYDIMDKEINLLGNFLPTTKGH